MASFTDLIAQRIYQRREEFIIGLSHEPQNGFEALLATEIQNHWHAIEPESQSRLSADQRWTQAAAVDGSHAIRALSYGGDWIVAQALLIGPNGLRKSAVDTLLLRGDIERPAVDRFASLVMRSLELDLAIKFVQDGAGNVLLLDGSLYSDLPYLLYNLTIGGYEDYPIKVLQQYLELFDLCQKCDVRLLGVAKSTRSTVLGRALLDGNRSSTLSVPPQQADTLQMLDVDVQDGVLIGDSAGSLQRRQNASSGVPGLPSDGELLHRWTTGIGLTDPVLLGSASFGHASAHAVAALARWAKQRVQEPLIPPHQQRMLERLSPLQERLLAAPAIGTFYICLAPGDDILRVDALASTFGRQDLRLLEFAQVLVPYTTALPIVRGLLHEYGGLSVYNAALYVVDQEVRLHAETVDRVYLPVLRRQLGHPVQYDRSTKRFIH